MTEYKLISAGHSDIEKQINAFGKDGWRVVSIAAAGGVGYTIFALLEKRS
jgi:hypothetical protein